eukprot:CAMPEP_0172315734 /NCGR_PEP_ID=MMETSP1058-20130122/26109_1 /TAXON_ID=83371 /ORGANISM="Detonula confervacea, Strain CCMP 353" /LENGTH=613 /DNA_ID=CAMNT_0013029885 /DNA_START=27 /DNA_END=1868 /DNA_ORIENTATION=+
MIDDVELDNERHRREEQERRAKRQKNRETKSKSGHQSEKERKRREHVQRILGAQKKKPPTHASSSAPSQPVSISGGGSSIFQSLFHERAEGFFIDLRFRNAPPRPPVGPTFVGLGLGGELTNKWAKYKARNAVENQYTWKLHPERDLGVPLAVSAMDYEGCYTDRGNKDNEKGEKVLGGDANKNSKSPYHCIPALLPEDEALINWKGSIGDTAAEQLQQKQDMVRAAARLAIAQGYGAMPMKMPNNTPSSAPTGGGNNSNGSVFRLKKHHLQSRILDEKTPNFMKKTTYLTNDATSVHRFTSLAHTQVQRAKDVDQALAETKTKYSEMDMIERGFREANCWKILHIGIKNTIGENRRIHPSQKDVHPMWDLPLLPDVPTWGHTYTHVVLDNPPKNISSNLMTPAKNTAKDLKQVEWNLFTAKQLHKAVVADVTKQTQNARMACTVWVPKSRESKKVLPEFESTEPATKKLKKGQMYLALQQYDLDVVPLRDPSVPPVHYVWMVDSSKKYVGYHCVGSRVQLSTGRPIVASGTHYGANTAEMATDTSYILHRSMEADEKKNLEIRMAEVDVDLAEKYGLVDANGLEEDENDENVGWGHKPIPESDSDEIEADAF